MADPYGDGEATQEVEDEAEATLVSVLEMRRDCGRAAAIFRSESQRDILPAVPPETVDLLVTAGGSGEDRSAAAAGNTNSGNVGAGHRRVPSSGGGSRPSHAHAAARGHRRAGSTSDAGTATTAATGADSRMNLLLAARGQMSQKNLNIDVARADGASSSLGGTSSGLRGVSRFAQLVMKVQEMNEESRSEDGGSRASGASRGGASSIGGTGAGAAASVKTSTTADDSNAPPSPFLGTSTVPGHNRLASNTEQLFQNAQIMEDLFNIEEEEDDDDRDDEGGDDDDNASVVPPPPPGDRYLATPVSNGGADIKYQGYHDEESPLVNTGTPSRVGSSAHRKNRLLGNCLDRLTPNNKRKSSYNPVMDVLGPKIVWGHIVRFLRTNFLFAIMPCFFVATILFCYCGNPALPFLPSHASLSWWFLFLCRQLVTLQLARATEYVAVEAIACRSSYAIKLLGPLVTLFAMQAKGWPFTVASWSAWDLLLLHGDHAFALSWLYYLDVPMLGQSDDGFLNSDIYLRCLLAAIFAGSVAAIKRTYLALYMGRRTFEHYKPQLEQLMVNIVFVAHIADLASETETPEFAEALAMTEESNLTISQRGRESAKGDKKWSSIQFEQSNKQSNVDDSDSSVEEDPFYTNELNGDCQGDGTKKMKWSIMLEGQSVASDDAPGRIDSSLGIDGESGSSPPMRTISAKHIGDGQHLAHPGYHRQTSSNSKMKNLLDRWEEPVNKLDNAVAPSIHDILQFRKALSYLDDSHPFSETFGPSETRDQCIKSSQKVFKRLLNFVPGETVLPFDIIGSIAMDEDGVYDRDVSLALVRLFRPDKDDCLTMLAFVQSCDWLYKKVRYLRASVANSTLIDRVLEHDFNILFYVFLILVVMSILNLNPWTLLFSCSTLLVSFAFAVGPSASKAIEGFFLIAMQRPYDLGDRICVLSAEFAGETDVSQNWFVEDVNLFTTTLRYAPTNEISTVNNGSIANSRIINFARSRKAMVNLTLLFRSDATSKQIQLFRSALDRYVKDNPRVWSSVATFLINDVDPDAEVAEYKLRVQHVKAWQEMVSVLRNKGELLQFCISLMSKLGIAYDSPKSRMSIELTTAKHVDANSQWFPPGLLSSGKRQSSIGSTGATK